MRFFLPTAWLSLALVGCAPDVDPRGRDGQPTTGATSTGPGTTSSPTPGTTSSPAFAPAPGCYTLRSAIGPDDYTLYRIPTTDTGILTPIFTSPGSKGAFESYIYNLAWWDDRWWLNTAVNVEVDLAFIHPDTLQPVVLPIPAYRFMILDGKLWAHGGNGYYQWLVFDTVEDVLAGTPSATPNDPWPNFSRVGVDGEVLYATRHNADHLDVVHTGSGAVTEVPLQMYMTWVNGIGVDTPGQVRILDDGRMPYSDNAIWVWTLDVSTGAEVGERIRVGTFTVNHAHGLWCQP